MRLSFRIVSLTICAVVLTACEFQAVTTIRPDGSGEFRSEVGYSAKERENLESQNGGSKQDFCNTTQRSQQLFPPDVVITQEQRGDKTWCITTTGFNSLEDLRQLYESKSGLKINRLEIVDERLYYDIDIDTLSEDSAFRNFTAATWTVHLPGTPLDQNADLAGEKSLSWNLTPRSGVINLHVESTVERPPFNALLVIVIGIALVLIGVTIISAVQLVRRSRRANRA